MKPIQYLMRELSFKATDWAVLSETDKADLKTWAAEEMAVLGIEVK